MRRYMVVQKSTLVSLLDSFTDEEEFVKFGQDMSDLLEEMIYTGYTARRNLEDSEQVTALTLKQYFLFALFCKDNIEVLQQMMRVVDYKEVSPEEKAAMDAKFPKGNLDHAP